MADGSAATPDRERKRPDSPIGLPSDAKGLLSKGLELIEACRNSSGIRAAYCRQLNAMTETGRQDGNRAIINMLHVHIERLAAHLFSPTGLRFMVEYDWAYGKQELQRADVAAKLLTRSWARSNRDMDFALGVFESLKYGAAVFKQWVETDGTTPLFRHSLIMPWQFGVYNESVNDINRQPAMCDTTLITLPEVWRRIWQLPNAEKLFQRIAAHAGSGMAGDDYNSFYHQVLSTTTMNTGATGLTRPIPGGVVSLNNNPNYAVLGPEINAPLVRFHELWVWDGDDYTTIQIVEPDILVAPLFRKSNLLIGGDHATGVHPYTLIQPNKSHGYFWGRSEIVDLIEPQGLLSTWSDDTKRLYGLQIDKILGLTGFDGDPAEIYDQFRAAGVVNGPMGADIKDLTPQMPPNAIAMLQFCMQVIDRLGGFDNMMNGQGQPGVRTQEMQDQLMRTASPSLRKRSLLTERQCAEAADLNMTLMQAKDSRNYWTDGTDQESRKASSFVLSDLPDDRQVMVDSHSTSPIFIDDNQQMVWAGVKAGVIGGEGVIDALPFQHKDKLKLDLKEREAGKAEMMKHLMQTDPKAATKMMKGG